MLSIKRPYSNGNHEKLSCAEPPLGSLLEVCPSTGCPRIQLSAELAASADDQLSLEDAGVIAQSALVCNEPLQKSPGLNSSTWHLK